MRIIAGAFRGLALASVGKGDTAAHLRPTTDRVRESLFNVLTKYDPFTDAEVLDLFAGTGALGLEALSRGASHVTFVDDGRAAQKLIAENITKTRSKDHTTLLRANATRLPAAKTAATLIFADPPYGKSLSTPALTSAQSQGWIAAKALIVLEDNIPQAPPGFALLDTRKYGDTHVSILRAP